MNASSGDASMPPSATRLGALLACLLAGVPARAEPGPLHFSATYRLSFLDLPVGEATLGVEQAGPRYAYDLKAGLRGLAGMFFEGGGTASARGERARTGALTGTFRTESLYGGKPVQVSMTLAGGRARDESVEPPPSPAPDRIPVAPQDKVGVVDPLTMLAIPLSGPLDPTLCERRIPVFNGAARADLVLSRGNLVTVTEGPYRGPALDCHVRWVPISGHRASGTSVRRMAQNDDMQVRLAPVPGGATLLPLRIAVATGWGTARIEATRWGEATSTGRGSVKVHLPNAR